MDKRLFKGAVAVEAAMVIGIFMFMVLLLFVFALAAFRYTILSDTTTSTLRSLSIDASPGYSNCLALKTAFATQAKNFITNTYATDGNDPDLYFDVIVTRTSTDPNDCRATISALSQWKFPALIPNIVEFAPLEVVQTREIEDLRFRRCGDCINCPPL